MFPDRGLGGEKSAGSGKSAPAPLVGCGPGKSTLRPGSGGESEVKTSLFFRPENSIPIALFPVINGAAETHTAQTRPHDAP